MNDRKVLFGFNNKSRYLGGDMPDSRKHRGQHPSDAKLFGRSQLPKLQQAVRDLSWLWSEGMLKSLL